MKLILFSREGVSAEFELLFCRESFVLELFACAKLFKEGDVSPAIVRGTDITVSEKLGLAQHDSQCLLFSEEEGEIERLCLSLLG